MARFFLFILLLFPLVISAQETKTVRNTVKRDNKFSSYTEKYHVLKENGVTKQGRYEKFDTHGRTITIGYYKNGKRDSLWKEYNIWSDFIAATGYYDNDRRIGVWTFNKDADTIELKYDFDKNKAVYFKPDNIKKYSVLSGSDTIKTMLQQPPLYLGGSNAIGRAVFDNISYPAEARENNIEGRVLVAFTIYPDGHASSPWILKSVHKSIDDEALKVANNISPDWVPGILNGNPITSIYVLPVVFKLE